MVQTRRRLDKKLREIAMVQAQARRRRDKKMREITMAQVRRGPNKEMTPSHNSTDPMCRHKNHWSKITVVQFSRKRENNSSKIVLASRRRKKKLSQNHYSTFMAQTRKELSQNQHNTGPLRRLENFQNQTHTRYFGCLKYYVISGGVAKYYEILQGGGIKISDLCIT